MTTLERPHRPSSERMRRKREKARAAGLCLACCKVAAAPQASICERCNVAAKARVARMRERRQAARHVVMAARRYEVTGDAAFQRFAYVEASTQFERALARSTSAEDGVRLCEKIGASIFFGARPDLASPWFERALERCSTPQTQARIPRILGRLVTQRWLESRTSESLTYFERAYEIAKTLPERDVLLYRTNVLHGIYLVLLGRYAEAASRSALLVRQSSGTLTRGSYFNQRAILRAVKGEATEAFADFDRALDIERDLPDGYVTTVCYDDYANWAMALGRFDIARSCRERALLIARERRIAWRIPYMMLRFANMLIVAGDYEHARDLLADAMTYDTETPVLRALKTTVAVELAHAIGDAALLRRTFNREALELAFRSGEPQSIGSIVAAYAKVAIARGQLSRAKKLIARGITAVNQADHVGDLLVLAGRYGSRESAARAEQLLLERIRLPHHRVAQAYLDLLKANSALRQHAQHEATEHAHKAALAFARLGWKHQRADAIAAAGGTQLLAEHETPVHRGILDELKSILTEREQQVAELALRGLTNRSIAEMFSISEHTVESHMTSILNRLGLRSRWQLTDLSR